MNKEPSVNKVNRMKGNKTSFWVRVYKYRYIYVLLIPGLLFFLIFKLIPIFGLVLAFQDFSPFHGVFESTWVGFKHFKDLFANKYFYTMLRNTLVINLMLLILYFPIPIILALMLNEVRHDLFKRLNQSIVYLPHFLSWVVIVGMTFFLISADVGLVNKALNHLGYEPISFLTNPNYFWGIITSQNIWKDAGWGTIIFLASIAGVDPERYESAVIDGAGRIRQIWHITLPAIRPVIIILLILRLGNFADVGFEQIILMMNPLVMDVAEIFDTYSYNHGILRGRISIGITVGMFKGIVGLVLIVTANYIVKKLGQEGIY